MISKTLPKQLDAFKKHVQDLDDEMNKVVRSYFAVCLFVCLISFFTSHKQSFSYKGTGLPGLNQ